MRRTRDRMTGDRPVRKDGKTAGPETGPSRSKPGFLECPECGKDVKEENLESHLRRVHKMSGDGAKRKADELLGGDGKASGGKPLMLIMAAVIILVIIGSVVAYLYYLQSRPAIDPNGNSNEYMPIAFTTIDGWDLHGDLYNGTAGKPYLILIHGMNEDRKAYRTFAKEMHAKGYGVLAYDSRGFGESKVKNGTFIGVIPKDEIRKGDLDVKGAMTALEQRGFTNNGVILVGASVGANVAAVYAANDTRVKYVVLLSPGDDYQGIQPMSSIRMYTGGILFVAYKGDDIAYESSLRFYSNATKASVRHEFYKAGILHGTGALTQSEMKSKIEAWIVSPS